MKRLNILIATAAVTAAASSSLAAGAEVEVLTEGFGNLAGPTDWDRLDRSSPPGAGHGADPSGFNSLLAINGGDVFPNEWRQWSAGLAVEGEGRVAFRYLGNPATPGYVGLDDVPSITPMPEPAGLLVLASGLGLIGLMQRRGRH
jgi:hypothetical protein